MTSESKDSNDTSESAGSAGRPIPRRVDRADYYSATVDRAPAVENKSPVTVSTQARGSGGAGTSPPLNEATDSSGGDDKDSLGFLDHLEELRWRLLKIIIGVLVAAAVSLYFGEEIFAFVIKPLGDLQLHVTTITGSFYAYMVVSIFAGLFAIIPFVFYQLWAFIAPGLYKTEKIFILPAVIASSVLFGIGAWFCYQYILPFAITYLVSYGEGALTPIITVGSYLTFAGMMVLSFGLTFNLPVVSFFLAKMGILRSETLPKGRRVAVVLILICAAIITPPDVFTQVLVGAPMYVLYEISIIVVRIANRNADKQIV